MTDGAGQRRSFPNLSRPTRRGDEVYEVLLSELMSLRIAPGSKITVDNLARELGVSQTPIREALTRLEAEGLVLKTHLIGFHAAPLLDREKFEEIFDLRLLLEPPLAARAASNMTDEQLDQLVKHAEKMRQDGSVLAYSRFAQDDATFHDLIIVGAGNGLIKDVLGRLHIHMHLFRLYYHSRVPTKATGEHAQIVDALVRRNPALAEKAMRRHITGSRERFLPVFDAERMNR